MALGLNKVEGAGLDRGGRARGRSARIAILSDFISQVRVSTEALIAGSILIFLQALDGILTSIGISRWGVSVEGNPLLRKLMMEFGHIPTLSVVKFIAICFVILLCCYSVRLPWMHKAMRAISCYYVIMAIIPWIYLLLVQQ